MKIALCSSFVPFVNGGYRNIVEWLEAMLLEAGHRVERVYLPEADEPELLFKQMAAYRFVDLSAADRIICFRPQSHLIPHPHKIVWFIHHLRVFYDLWDSPYRSFPDDAKYRGIRDALRAADTAALAEAQRVFSNSSVVSERLRRYNGVDSEPLFPPVYKPERFHHRSMNDEIVCICRIEHHKRQHLLIEALSQCRTPVRLRIAGRSSGPDYPQQLARQVAAHGLGDRVVLDERWISEEEKENHLADCLAAAYVPLDEDSYGYPILEAAHARKPILTTTDAGGPLEFVRHGHDGLVSDPAPDALAAAMDRLYADRAEARRMGEEANARIDALHIGWPHVLERLLA
ncbi:glycosyltransferase family 4 protein [Variovorax sp. PBL-E5]|uniref:glycosyltransferase family 4 protein n=1 Tax=Variovorax sp. PBL-E5 TaxID=434014 RepID=UPI001316D539|nr:glycosyltransferase family 4 protein [Variovorax sp. PBL-E5]VTU19005.1 GDP-mannose-dependent alpha-(1-6)-phosphatidylinositol monomannoside mannosyltransferase [Variovorax sp. PBL-E5]